MNAIDDIAAPTETNAIADAKIFPPSVEGLRVGPCDVAMRLMK